MAATPPIIEKYRGKFIARGGPAVTLEDHAETRRIVLIEFPDLTDAEVFFHSQEYSEARKLREGVPSPSLSPSTELTDAYDRLTAMTARITCIANDSHLDSRLR